MFHPNYHHHHHHLLEKHHQQLIFNNNDENQCVKQIFYGINQLFHQQNMNDSFYFAFHNVLHSISLLTRFFFSIVCSLYRTQLEFICAHARTEMKRKTNNRLQHLSCTLAFHLPLASRPAIVRYRAKPLNEGKNVMKNDI